MTLTKEVLTRIIKEELEKLVAAQAEETETEVDPADAKIEELEKQLAEAKKAKAAGKGTKKGLGAKPHPSHSMKPLKSSKK
jgi:uncharacterized protein involved in exopolysaccharide biosynthesis